MRIIHDAWGRRDLPCGTVGTIGNFDGLHRGQQAILERVVTRAGATGLEPAVVTFEPHPLTVLRPEAAPARIVGFDHKAELLAAAGIAVLAVVRFSTEFARTPAAGFVEEFLHHGLDMREIYVGSRFAFGRQREGDLALLREMGARLGFAAHGVPEVLHDGAPVSSTRIREAVYAGRVEEAAALLGRPFVLRGRVVHGQGRGKGLGWPTVNLAPDVGLLPADGVYVSTARLGGEPGPLLGAVTNVGRRPTFDDPDGRVVESHLLDFDRDLYGERVELSFLSRLREERAFQSLEQLVEQIGRDVARAREFLTREGCLEKRTEADA